MAISQSALRLCIPLVFAFSTSAQQNVTPLSGPELSVVRTANVDSLSFTRAHIALVWPKGISPKWYSESQVPTPNQMADWLEDAYRFMVRWTCFNLSRRRLDAKIPRIRLESAQRGRADSRRSGMINRQVEDHLIAASAGGRVLFTYNKSDYCALGLHQSWLSLERPHAGIIVAPQQQYSVGEEFRRIMRLISRDPAEQMQNRLEFLSSWA